MCVLSERNTYAQTEIAQTVYAVRKEVTFVRTVAVIGCEMQARSISPRIHIETNFRRYIETPCIFVGFEYVES